MDKNRLISNEEIDLLLDFSQTSETEWDILLGSSDKKLSAYISDIFLSDNRVNLIVAETGCDMLLASASELPHLIIIDEELEDISVFDAVDSIKKRDDFKDIKIMLCVKSENTVDWNRSDVDDYLVKDYNGSEYMSRKILSLLHSSDHESAPKRRWPRTNVKITAQLELKSINDPDLCIHGQALVENISRTGACLSNIKLDRKLDMDDTFRVSLKIDEKPLKDWKAESMIVRLKDDETLGIKFISISRMNRKKITGIDS